MALLDGVGYVLQVGNTPPAVAPPFCLVDVGTSGAQPGWKATEAAGLWSFAAPVPQPGPTLAQEAQAALDDMDSPGGCAIRCFKAGVAFPANWQAYTAELRAIVNGSASPMPTALPVQPAYPAGT